MLINMNEDTIDLIISLLNQRIKYLEDEYRMFYPSEHNVFISCLPAYISQTKKIKEDLQSQSENPVYTVETLTQKERSYIKECLEDDIKRNQMIVYGKKNSLGYYKSNLQDAKDRLEEAKESLKLAEEDLELANILKDKL